MTAVQSFSWLETLEKEFDKAAVQLQSFVNDCVDEEVFTENSLDELHKALETACSMFAQVALKSQLVFQQNAKLEAQVLDLRSQIGDANASRLAAEKEVSLLIIELHKAQLEMAELTDTRADFDAIRQSLQAESERRVRESLGAADSYIELEALRAECAALRERVTLLEADLFASRIAAKYLDKELVGRIQQLQLLFKEVGTQALRSDESKSVWHQLDTEIQLHRHKAIIRACQFNAATAAAQRASLGTAVSGKTNATAKPAASNSNTNRAPAWSAPKANAPKTNKRDASESESEDEEESGSQEESESDEEPRQVEQANAVALTSRPVNSNLRVNSKSKVQTYAPQNSYSGNQQLQVETQYVNKKSSVSKSNKSKRDSDSISIAAGRSDTLMQPKSPNVADYSAPTPPGLNMPAAYQSGLSVSPYPTPTAPHNNNSATHANANANSSAATMQYQTQSNAKADNNSDLEKLAHRCEMRRVQLLRDAGGEGAGGLGLSIMGGREHGLPIVVSEVHPGTPAQRSGAITVGDTILRVNGVDVRNAAHCDAVRALTQRSTVVDLELMHVELTSSEEEEEESESESESGNDTAIAPRTPLPTAVGSKKSQKQWQEQPAVKSRTREIQPASYAPLTTRHLERKQKDNGSSKRRDNRKRGNLSNEI